MFTYGIIDNRRDGLVTFLQSSLWCVFNTYTFYIKVFHYIPEGNYDHFNPKCHTIHDHISCKNYEMLVLPIYDDFCDLTTP